MSNRSGIINNNDEPTKAISRQGAIKTRFHDGRTWLQSEKRYVFFLRNAHLILMWPLLSIILSVLMWKGIDSELSREKNILQTGASNDVMSLSKSYAEYLNSTIERIDQVMMQVKYDWDVSNHAYRLEGPARKGIFNFRYSAAITIVDRNGKPITSTYPFDEKATWSDSRAFRLHRLDPSNQLRIETPVEGKISGRTIIRMTRRLNDPNGQFAGMIVVSVAPAYFFSFASVSGLGAEGFQALGGQDKAVRVVKETGFKSKYDKPLLRAIPVGSSPMRLAGYQWFADGKPRYVASYPVANYPFFAIVGISEESALAHYESNRVTYRNAGILINAVLALFTLVAMFLSIRLALKTQRLDAIRTTYRVATEGGKEGYYMWSAIRDENMNLVDFEIIDCNERGAELFGANRDKLLNTRLSGVEAIRSYWASLMSQCRTAMETGFYEDDFEAPNSRDMHAEWLRKRMVRSEGGLAVTLRDISTQKAHEKELTRLATRDTLTNLPNRHWMMTFLPTALEEATKEKSALAILFIDLDDFKNVNDTLGHSAGDILLQTVASRLQSILRPTDCVARLGGDEFTFVLKSTERSFNISSIAERILQVFGVPFEIQQRSLNIGASIGISVFPHDGADAETLVKNADIAMYAAKAEGKGKFRFYDHNLYRQIEQRLYREQELLRAIQEDHFVMHYQPRVDTLSGKLLGMEALVRWMHPERGMISPNDFIPLAESSRMILSLGKLAMEKVFAQLAAWKLAGLPLVPISVNVSAHQFDEGGLSEFIRTCLHKYCISAELIEVELTESAMMGDFGRVSSEIAAINALGIRMHIDDFGTGYSSLSLLHKLSMSVLKVDRAFTAQLANDNGGEIFYSAIISMAKALQMRIVAEGVETEDQLRILQELGCDEIQGYFISPPLPPEAIPAMMQKRIPVEGSLFRSVLEAMSGSDDGKAVHGSDAVQLI